MDATVQNQQNSRFNVGLYGLVVVLRLNTYFQLRYFIFCTTKIAVLSFVFLGVPFDFFISIEGRGLCLRCGRPENGVLSNGQLFEGLLKELRRRLEPTV